jgi:hypothetical protein
VTVSSCRIDTVRSNRTLEQQEAGMEATVPPCGYLSRVVDLPVAIAEVLFDDATTSLGPTSRVEPVPIGTALLPALRVRTRLRPPFPWAGVPVEVELTPWSRSRSEVGVRYGGNGRPHAIARYVYETQAVGLLDRVTDAMNARLPGAAAERRAA